MRKVDLASGDIGFWNAGKPPTDLKGNGRKYWTHLAAWHKQLEQDGRGFLLECDATTIAMCCQAYDFYKSYERRVVSGDAERDDTKPKEVVATLSKLQDNYLKVAGKLGLLPTTRLSLSAQAQPTPPVASPKEKFPDIPGLQ